MLASIYTRTLRERTAAMLVGTLAIGLFLLMAMAVYGNLDPSFYYDLPEALLEPMGISAALGGVAGIAYGALFGLIGAMTLGGLAISAGADGIAGEERGRTIGLLLSTPRSRSQLLAAKLAALVTLLAGATLVVWGAAEVVPVILDVDVTGAATGALSLHLGANALVWGSLAAALGAWTGRRGLASGVSAGVMVLSWLLVSFLPLLGEVWADIARVVPWYWFNGHGPEAAGVSGTYLALQIGLSMVLLASAFVGIARRDLREGERSSPLVERVLAHPRAAALRDRMAGSVRTSRIAVKSTTDHQGLLLGASAVLLYVGLLTTPLYNFLPSAFTETIGDLPEAMIAAIGGVDMSTPIGWIQGEHFSLVVPMAMIAVLAAMGAAAIAGEEEDRTLDLLLANPIPRWRVVVEKALAMVANAALLGVVTFIGVAVGIVIGGLDVSILNAAATSLLGSLLGLVFGGIALAVSAATGRRQWALAAAAGFAALSYVVDSFFPLAESFAPWANLSPFHYYLGSNPLAQGMAWGDAAILATLFIVLVGLAIPLFNRRSIRG